ncbi:hypothetical protein KUV46_15710 [Thalassovita mediterranea]|nr:hypothetical protein KUV46_15710 [Thalassovita mediterranea]
MAEDWAAIAAEVTEALKSVSDVSQPSGYPATVRQAGTPSGPAYDRTPGVPTYTTVWCVETMRDVRDQTGTAIIRTERVLMVSATEGITVSDDDYIVPGVEADDVDADTLWENIESVKPLSPAGTTLMQEVVLSGTQTKLAFEG